MKNWLETVEPLVYESRIKVPYTWSVGEVGSRFLIELRDHKKIYGTRCPSVIPFISLQEKPAANAFQISMNGLR